MIKINKEFLDKNIKHGEFINYKGKVKTSTDMIFRQMIRNSNYKVKSIDMLGSIKSMDSLAVSVVGSRNITEYGRKVVNLFVKELVEHDITIISGLMYGVDIEAHKVAIKNGGRTIGVLGYGFNYLSKNIEAKEVSESILNNSAGAIISEYGRFIPGNYWTFPRRNKIVSALSRTTIVIEASEHSGTSLTANYTNQQNKPVFVIPGSVFSKQSVGAHKLIKDGAILLDNVADVLSYFNLESSIDKKFIVNSNLSMYDTILKGVNELEVSFDEILIYTGYSPGLLNTLLTKLELNGILSRSISGNWYRL